MSVYGFVGHHKRGLEASVVFAVAFKKDLGK
jgi:hypothetical protein